MKVLFVISPPDHATSSCGHCFPSQMWTSMTWAWPAACGMTASARTARPSSRRPRVLCTAPSGKGLQCLTSRVHFRSGLLDSFARKEARMGVDLLVFLFACLSLCLHSPKGLLSQAHVRNPISGPAAELGPLQLRELRVSITCGLRVSMVSFSPRLQGS